MTGAEIASAVALDALKVALLAGLKQAAAAAKTTVAEWNLDVAARHLVSVAMIRPIWNASTEVDLISLHYPCPIRLRRKSIRPTDLESFESNRIVITGNVGQGKSILLRFLARQETLTYRARARPPIPLFIELRRLQKAEGILGLLARQLRTMGIPTSGSALDPLLRHQAFTLLFDGFDEVQDSQKSAVIDQLERLGARYVNLTIFVTSRPHTAGIERLAGFDVAELPQLDEQTRRGLITSQFGSDRQEAAAKLLSELALSPIEALLTTPLMVALLIIHYSAYGKLPVERESFHEDLFDALLRRHDAAKPGFVRSRKSKLSDYMLRLWFDRISFRAQERGEFAWDRRQAVALVAKAVPLRGEATSADDVLDDISNITSLILEEGGEYRFAHKLIMEYHAASFVRAAPAGPAKMFYNKLTISPKWKTWQQTLEFCSRIDRFRYLASFERNVLRAFAPEPTLTRLVGPGRGRIQKTVPLVLQIEGSWLWETLPVAMRANAAKVLGAAIVNDSGVLNITERATLSDLGELELPARELPLSSNATQMLTKIGAWADKRLRDIESELAEAAADEDLFGDFLESGG